MKSASALVALVLLALWTRAAGAQSNTDIGAANSPSELAIAHGRDQSNTDHLFIAVKTAGNKAGHYVSDDRGRTWAGSDTIPGNHDNDNDPWGALDTRLGFA